MSKLSFIRARRDPICEVVPALEKAIAEKNRAQQIELLRRWIPRPYVNLFDELVKFQAGREGSG